MWAEDSKLNVVVHPQGAENFSCKYKINNHSSFIGVENVNIAIKMFSQKSPAHKFMDYRLCRFATWHEAMHVKHTPAILMDRVMCDDTIKNTAFNLMEDYRIEGIGLDTYPGYIEERDLAYLGLMRLMKDEVKDMTDAVILFKHIALKARYGNHELVPSLPAKYSLGYSKEINDIIDRMQVMYTHDDCIDLSRDLSALIGKMAKELGDNILEDYDGNVSFRDRWKMDGWKMMSGTSGHCESFCDNGNKDSMSSATKDKVEGVLKEHQAPESIVEEYSLSEKLKSDGDDIDDNGEMTRLIGERKMEVLRPDNGIRQFLEYRAKAITLTRSLTTKVRLTKKEYKEKLNGEGDEIDTDSFIQSESNFYISDDRLKPINDILILLDMSGSTRSFEEHYNPTAVAMCETLSSLGLRYGVYGFNESKGSFATLYVYKTKTEPYNNTVKARLGAIQHQGMTPMQSAFSTLKAVEKDYKTAIIFTDGDTSQDIAKTKQALSKLNMRKYVIGYSEEGLKDGMKNGIKAIMPDGSRFNFEVITDPTHLPRAVMSIVARDKRT